MNFCVASLSNLIELLLPVHTGTGGRRTLVLSELLHLIKNPIIAQQNY